MNDAILELSGISYAYSEVKVIQNITANIAQGEFLGIIGPNGSGKTTLLKLLCGLLVPAEGRIHLKGQPLSAISKNERAKIIGFLPQEQHYFHNIKVSQVILLARTPYLHSHFFETHQDITAVQEAMEIAEIKHLTDRYLHELSGGEKQMVHLAKLIAQNAEILILDEPTTFLDIKHVIKIMNTIKKMHDERKITIIASMHDLNIAAMYCNRLIMLKEGRIISAGAPAEVLTYRQIKEGFGTEFYIDVNDLTGEPIVLPLSPRVGMPT